MRPLPICYGFGVEDASAFQEDVVTIVPVPADDLAPSALGGIPADAPLKGHDQRFELAAHLMPRDNPYALEFKRLLAAGRHEHT